jgi:tetraacyldisaccharide 4'-kinase
MAQAARESGWQGMAQRRGALAALLWPLSLVYRALLACRRWAHTLGTRDTGLLPVPVVVVGNVVVGGAGKTPTTIALVEHLTRQGWRVGVVSRGHGRRAQGVMAVLADTDPAASGDEPRLIRQRTGVPTFVGRQRVQAARDLLAAHPDVTLIVCDDGLQHWALRSDVRIAVFDDRGLGNGWLLPAGLLREPWPVRHAAHAPQIMLCHTRAGDAAGVPVPQGVACFGARRRLGDFAVDARGQRRSLADFAARPTLTLAAIARPEVFFAMLADAGVTPHRHLPLPDHADATVLNAALAGWRGDVLCTEKDLVKLDTLPDGMHAWAVPLELQIEPGFFAAVDARLAALRA